MRIYTPPDIKDVAWEGVLIPATGAVDDCAAVPRVTLAEPAWWSAETLMAHLGTQAWSPPNREWRYVLVRLGFSLQPLRSEGAFVRQAALTATLTPYHAVPEAALVRDLYPHRLTDRGARKYDLHLDKWLRFQNTTPEAPAEAAVGIEYIKTYPVIQGYGAGKCSPYWRFTYDTGRPLVGCQTVYMLVEAPEKTGGVRIDLQLMTEVQTAKTRFSVSLPGQARAQIRRAIDRH